MHANKNSVALWVIGVAGAISLGFGCLVFHPLLLAGGVIGVGYVVAKLVAGRPGRRAKVSTGSPGAAKPAVKRAAPPTDPNDPDALFEQMLTQGRYALLLRPQIAENLRDDQLEQAVEALKEGMALVPDGEVMLGQFDEPPSDEEEGREEAEIVLRESRMVRVAAFFLDRYPVTNRQFYEFVVGGGYEQISFWDESIWTAVLDFVDQTRQPGPRFWKDGCYAPGKKNHPVIGVCWHEAVAYARWIGKRLPSDAEWVKAGSWPVNLSGDKRSQRRYPWGGTMDRQRANLWGSGPKGTVPVDQFSEGVSVGGVYQLIGNVWEWTRGNFPGGDLAHQRFVLETPMKSVRGGAFDTYFDNQATCQFQSGDVPITRKHNVGFRCGVGVCDLMLARSRQATDVPDESESESLEEVQA